MAITSTDLSARLRFTDSKNKTAANYAGIKPSAAADKVAEFTGALELLKGKTFGFTYLTVEAELTDDI